MKIDLANIVGNRSTSYRAEFEHGDEPMPKAGPAFRAQNHIRRIVAREFGILYNLADRPADPINRRHLLRAEARIRGALIPQCGDKRADNGESEKG